MCEQVAKARSSLQYETDQSDEGGCRSVRKRYTVNRIRLQTRNFLDQDCDVPLTAVLPPLMKGSFFIVYQYSFATHIPSEKPPRRQR